MDRTNREFCAAVVSNGEGFVFDVNSGKIVSFLNQTQLQFASSALLNEKGQQFLYASHASKNTIFVYHTLTNEALFYCSQQELVTSMQISSSQIYMFGGTKNGNVMLWKTKSGKLMKISKVHMKEVSVIRVSPKDQFIITGSKDTFVHVFMYHDFLSVNSKKQVKPRFTISSHSLPISDIFIMEDRFLTSSYDRSVRMFDLINGTEILTVLFPSSVLSLTLDHLERSIFVGCENGKVYETNLYPSASRKLSTNEVTSGGSFSHPENELLYPTAVVSLISGRFGEGGKKTLSIEHFIEKKMGEYLKSKEIGYFSHVYFGHKNYRVNMVRMCKLYARRLLSCSDDGTVIMWDTQSKQKVGRIQNNPNSITKIMSMHSFIVSVKNDSNYRGGGGNEETETSNTLEEEKKKTLGSVKPLEKYIQRNEIHKLEVNDVPTENWKFVFSESDKKSFGISNDVFQILKMDLNPGNM